MAKNGLPKRMSIQRTRCIKQQLVAASYIVVIGALIIPAHARAGFFSNLAKFFLPDSAVAVSDSSRSAATISLPLLGSRQVSQQPDEVGSDGKKTDPDPSPLAVVQDSALVGSLNPLGIMSENGQDKIIPYVVQSGDTGRGIANKFGISLNTLLWANDLKSVSEIGVGDTLVVLPVSGIQYEVRKGDTFDSIVKKFKPKDMTDEQDILSFKADISSFNDLAINEALEPGSTILIPDGELTVQVPSKPPRPGSSGGGGGSRFANLPEYRGYYLRPIIGGRHSRGIHGYNGIDLANSCGLPVLASADGIVIIARTSGWNGGYGKYVVISHGNGTQTLYAHLSAVLAAAGQRIDQATQIGAIGSTGNSTGCHVHFEIRGARNLF